MYRFLCVEIDVAIKNLAWQTPAPAPSAANAADPAPATAQALAQSNSEVNGGSTNGTADPPLLVAALPKEHEHSLIGLLTHGQLIDATFPSDLRDQSWQQWVSTICVAMLWRSYTPLYLVGFMVEFTLNFIVLNGGLFFLLLKFINPFSWHSIVIPNRHGDDYLSAIGHMDPRAELFLDTSPAGKAESTRADTVVFPDENVGSQRTADVCVMASKLAYENPAVVERVVTKIWKMHFVKFFNCWNEYQKMHNTQVFIMMDKPADANAVVVAFRGTEGFNAYDWSTDFDFSWVELETLGKVHLGFLEALGLATRGDLDTLSKLRDNARRARERKPQHQTSFRTQSLEEINQSTAATSGLANYLVHDPGRCLAFDDITHEIALIMHNNPKAKLFITGHSLGGALATLYPTMLFYTKQEKMTEKIGAVYTFGQPRVGDEGFKKYVSDKLKGRYFRIVYCNDMVPRIPFDDGLMKFKHFGNCEYFNSVYDGLNLVTEPNPNYFGFGRMLTMHLNASWEMFQAMILISLQHGKEYSESWFSIMSRMMGLMIPGASAHSLTNYVNAVRLGPLRLGPFPLRERIEGDAAEFLVMVDNVKDIMQAVTFAFMKLLGFPVPNQGLKVA